jgi:acid phosphatase (class A)
MRRLRVIVVCALLVACPGLLPAHAGDSFFVSQDTVNLLVLLPPPPGPQDPVTVAELDELRQLQRTRTPARVAVAKADVEETVFRLMIVFNKPLTPEQLPKTAAFFKKLTADEEVATDPAKKGFARPRPYAAASDLQPVCPLSSSWAYPSGHTTIGYYMGVVLAAMVPEQREAIFARTQEFAESRMICGVHYRSDIEAGRTAGTVLAAVAMNHPQFRAEFAEAKAELRAALGM